MMLSDLYGRIGQILAEHGDAPIGKIKAPMPTDELLLPMDLVKPLYCNFTLTTTEIVGVKIRSYEPLIDE